MAILCGLFSGMTMIASLGIFFSTFFPEKSLTVNDFPLLHIAALLAFCSAFPVGRRYARQYQAKYHCTRAEAEEWMNGHFHQWIAGWPPWLRWAPVAFLAVNGVVFAWHLREGGPEWEDGGFVIANHGRIIRVITEEEYKVLSAQELRGASAFWSTFFVLATLFHFGVCPRMEVDLSRRQPQNWVWHLYHERWR